MIRSASQFGALVRKRRRETGLTQAELAERIGSGERFIVDLEGGKPTCQLEKSILAAIEVGIELRAEHRADESPDDDPEDDLSYLPRFP